VSDFSIDIRGDKEFQAKLNKLRAAKVGYKYVQGGTLMTENYIKTKAVRASGGKPIPLKLTRRSGGGSITLPHSQISQEGQNVVGRIGMTGDKGDLMKMHERGGNFLRRIRTRKGFKSYRYHLPARPTFKRTKLWAQKTMPKMADKLLKKAIQAAGLR